MYIFVHFTRNTVAVLKRGNKNTLESEDICETGNIGITAQSSVEMNFCALQSAK